MKTLEFIYQETQIHFLLNPSSSHVMVNATEMAKLFNRRVDVFMKTDHAKSFIEIMEHPDNRPPKGGQIIENRGRNGVYFDRRLALKFAAWLSPEFEFWVFDRMDQILFGNYKLHWDAHTYEQECVERKNKCKEKMLMKPTPELVREYFLHEKAIQNCKYLKRSAIKQQYALFDE